VYLNFCESPGGGAPRAFDEKTYARLRDVKARYDGGDLFRSNHHVEPALR
jgi:Berberine and berberine like